MPTQRLGGVWGSAPSLGGPGGSPRRGPGLAPARNAADRPRSKRRSDPNGDWDKIPVEVKDQGVVRDRVGRIIGVSSPPLYIIGVTFPVGTVFYRFISSNLKQLGYKFRRSIQMWHTRN